MMLVSRKSLVAGCIAIGLIAVAAARTSSAAIILDSSSSNQLIQADEFDLASGPVTTSPNETGDMNLGNPTQHPTSNASNGWFLRAFDYNVQPSDPNGDGSATFDWVQFELDVQQAGFYDVELSYNIGSSSDQRQIELFIDAGGPLQSIALWNMGAGDLMDTGNWNVDFAFSDARNVLLPAGSYNLRVQSGDGATTNRGTNLDALRVNFDVVPEPSSLVVMIVGILSLCGCRSTRCHS